MALFHSYGRGVTDTVNDREKVGNHVIGFLRNRVESLDTVNLNHENTEITEGF
jgi:hypothetical protein